MIGIKKTTGFLVLFIAMSLLTTPAFAAFLGTAYNDGAKVWSDSTSFPSNPPENPALAGYVDWIVYAPGDFPAEYSGYTPTSGEFTYVYQIYCTGWAPITFYGVSIENPAENIGTFSYTDPDPNPPDNSITGDVPYDMSLESSDGGAVWYFAGIDQSDHSQALAYSSPNTPQDFWSLAINHGDAEYVIPVPSPSSNPIPEPATIWSLLIGLGLLMATRRLQKR